MIGRTKVRVVFSGGQLYMACFPLRRYSFRLCWMSMASYSTTLTYFVGSFSLEMPMVRERGRVCRGKGSPWWHSALHEGMIISV